VHRLAPALDDLSRGRVGRAAARSEEGDRNQEHGMSHRLTSDKE